MKTFIITRFRKNQNGVYGVFENEMRPGAYEPFAVTRELAWLDNIRSISCIPPGEYIAKRYSSNKYKNTFEIQNVPGRTYILIHIGNFKSDSKGCILVGEYFDEIDNVAGADVGASGKAFKQFLEMTGKLKSFKLIIREV